MNNNLVLLGANNLTSANSLSNVEKLETSERYSSEPVLDWSVIKED